jgi:hypothetical protein
MKGDLTMPFERIPGVELEVNNFDARVVENPFAAPPAAMPSTVIKTTQPWAIQVNWRVIGIAAPVIFGTWYVEGYLESMGIGAELEVPEGATPMAGAGDYTVNLLVPAGFVPVTPGEPSTPFKLTVTLTARALNGVPYPMAGYIEGPILQFYTTP